MKYMVMECSKGRAVLMDEKGGFVFAANLGYEVGQSVTDPILLVEKEKTGNRIIVMRTIAAAAASAAILFAPCYTYYARNLKPCSAVTITSYAAISMELNRDGKVISLQSDSDYGKELIEKHDIKGKDKMEAVNEILQSEITDGYLTDGDTVDVYIESKTEEAYHSYKTEFEEEIPKLDIKVNVHEKDEKKLEPLPKEEHTEKVKPVKPVPPAEDPDALVSPAPAPEDAPPKPGDEKNTPEPPVHPEAPKPGAEKPEKLPEPEAPEKPEPVLPHENGKEETELPAQPQTPTPPPENKPQPHQKPHLQVPPALEEEKTAAPDIEPLQKENLTD